MTGISALFWHNAKLATQRGAVPERVAQRQTNGQSYFPSVPLCAWNVVSDNTYQICFKIETAQTNTLQQLQQQKKQHQTAAVVAASAAAAATAATAAKAVTAITLLSKCAQPSKSSDSNS